MQASCVSSLILFGQFPSRLSIHVMTIIPTILTTNVSYLPQKFQMVAILSLQPSILTFLVREYGIISTPHSLQRRLREGHPLGLHVVKKHGYKIYL